MVETCFCSFHYCYEAMSIHFLYSLVKTLKHSVMSSMSTLPCCIHSAGSADEFPDCFVMNEE